MSYLEILKAAAPETIVVLTAIAVLMADGLALRGLDLRARLMIGAMIAVAGCALATGWLIVLPLGLGDAGGLLASDLLTRWVRISLLVLTIFTLLLSVDSDFTPHIGEYLALILLAAVGMMLLVASRDILMIFLSLELTSLSLYILTAFDKRNRESIEAALKYFLFGGISAAFTLLGLSFLYGLSGSTSLEQIAAAIQGPKLDLLLVAALVLTVIGLGFKVAAAPFHLWAPDAYQGAPVPSAAFIASGSKVAGFIVLAKVMSIGFHGAEGSATPGGGQPGWLPLIAILAVLSMVIGNLAAIAQTSVRRLLAYSAIAHAGYALLGVMAHSVEGDAALAYYVVTYGFTTIGAFGVVAAVEKMSGGSRLSDFAGLSRRAPLVSACMLVFMLSLAGIPPLAGFFGKFYVFVAALHSGKDNLSLLWLVGLALATSAISLYYYLKVLKQIYVAQPPDSAPLAKPSALLQVTLALLALAVVLLGCFPNLFLGRLIGHE